MLGSGEYRPDNTNDILRNVVCIGALSNLQLRFIKARIIIAVINTPLGAFLYERSFGSAQKNCVPTYGTTRFTKVNHVCGT